MGLMMSHTVATSRRGSGREGGPEVMENYTQYKSVWIDLC